MKTRLGCKRCNTSIKMFSKIAFRVWGVHNNFAWFSPFRTAPRTVVRLALYFTVQNADHLKSAQYIHQDFLWYCKAYNTSSDSNWNWQRCVFHFKFCMLFVFRSEFMVCIFHFLFYCFALTLFFFQSVSFASCPSWFVSNILKRCRRVHEMLCLNALGLAFGVWETFSGELLCKNPPWGVGVGVS